MKYTNLRKTLIAAALIGATTLANAQQGGMGPGMMGPGMMGPGMMGPGMMGGYGPGGMGGSSGPGYGCMGPGMMGGMMGPGMMGGMMGHGMMGPGMTGGMMGQGMGGTMGPGMMGGGMGYGMLQQLNLSPDQWNKINAIHEDLAKKQWDLTGKTREEAYKLRNLLASEKRDRNAITGQYKKLQELRLQVFQGRLDTHEKINATLTKEQQAQLRRFAPWWGQHVE
jgi:Spy/CpxP family protein refolding chaperone